MSDQAVDVEKMQAAGFEPPDNICASCRHEGGAHDLNNWCLVCPRPEYVRTGRDPFRARLAAGWDYFSSMDENARWDYGIGEYTRLVSEEAVS